MKIICKEAGESCPKGLNICCGVCEHIDLCTSECEFCDNYKECPDAETINDELVAFQSGVPDTIKRITDLIQMKKQLDEQEKELKATLVKAMENYGVKSFENDIIRMTYVAPTTRSTIDSARLKKDHPDIVAEYTKVSDVAASVRVTLKGGGK